MINLGRFRPLSSTSTTASHGQRRRRPPRAPSPARRPTACPTLSPAPAILRMTSPRNPRPRWTCKNKRAVVEAQHYRRRHERRISEALGGRGPGQPPPLLRRQGRRLVAHGVANFSANSFSSRRTDTSEVVEELVRGCLAISTHLPMASASATVVHSTSVRDGFTSTLKSRHSSSAWSTRPWKTDGTFKERNLASMALLSFPSPTTRMAPSDRSPPNSFCDATNREASSPRPFCHRSLPMKYAPFVRGREGSARGITQARASLVDE